jgi:hypothetical protein
MNEIRPPVQEQNSSFIYCHVSGVCVTNKTGLDLMIQFIGPLHNWLQQFTNRHLTQCHLLPTGHSTGTIQTSIWTVNCLSFMLRPTVSRPVCLGIKHPSGAYDQIFITVRRLLVCWCVALSLMRGRVCHLQFCWPSFSGPSPVGLVTIFYCLRLETSLSSPPTTRRATVEVFNPASTLDELWIIFDF